jgi:hypothetical protein
MLTEITLWDILYVEWFVGITNYLEVLWGVVIATVKVKHSRYRPELA